MDYATADTRANRYDVVSRLADDLAHEIRNPLNAIVVNLEVLRRRVGTGARDQALAQADIIEAEIARLTKLVDQLVFLMRPPRNEANPIALDETIDDMRPLLETQAMAARVGFEMVVGSDLFTHVPRDVIKFAVLNVITSIYESGAALAWLRVETRPAKAAAEIAISSRPAVIDERSEFVRQARAMIELAGGTLELSAPDSGSTAVLRFPASRSFV